MALYQDISISQGDAIKSQFSTMPFNRITVIGFALWPVTCIVIDFGPQ